MKYLLLVLFLLPFTTLAEPYSVEWDPVTQYNDNTDIPAGVLVKYNVYRKTRTGEYSKLTSTILTHYTQQIVQWGHFVYRVTAIVPDRPEIAESDPSNEHAVFFDIRGKEEEP